MPFDARRKLTRAERDAARGKLARMRGEAIARLLAGLTRDALASGQILTPLNREAVHRHTLRRVLILEGWRWRLADEAAAEVVRVSLEILRAKRPTWAEGQPDYVINPGLLIERTRCAECGKKLPPERPKFCSDGCANAFRLRQMRRMQADSEQAAAEIERARP